VKTSLEALGANLLQLKTLMMHPMDLIILKKIKIDEDTKGLLCFIYSNK